MIEVQAIVDQGQDQEQIQIGIELDVISVESMITLQRVVPHNEDREIEQIQQMFNLDEEQTSLKALATDMYDNLNKI